MATIAIDGFMNRMIDIDSHEMMPIHMWGEAFGDVGAHISAIDMKRYSKTRKSENSIYRDDIAADVTEITYDTVWKLKGPEAPSAIDFSRRPQVMDLMGVERQLVYPSFGLLGMILLYTPKVHEYLQYDNAEIPDPRKTGREACDAHNRWAAAVTKMTAQRVRPVGIVIPESLDAMMRQAEHLIAEGVRAVLLPAGAPPADTSPADKALDPFWALLASNDIPVTFHLGTEFAFLSSLKWSANVPEFVPFSETENLEFEVEPYRGSTVHYCMENYLSAMILGGVLERHPNLRVGVIEACAHWVGPLADCLDMWAGQFSKRLSKTLSMKPSEYLNRNVRATPFSFEPVDMYLKRYPELANVYSFSTDFPHVEGGKEARDKFLGKLSLFNQATREKFFRTNGLLLTPE